MKEGHRTEQTKFTRITLYFMQQLLLLLTPVFVNTIQGNQVYSDCARRRTSDTYVHARLHKQEVELVSKGEVLSLTAEETVKTSVGLFNRLRIARSVAAATY